MREICFKAKRLDNGEWVEGLPYWGEYSGTFILQNKTYRRRNARTGEISMGDNVVPIEVDPSTVCEYTGLTDKNGKKIFEGDIVTTDLKRPYLIVEFRDACFMFNCNDGDKDYYDIFLPITDVAHEEYQYGEVIGNLHDGEGGRHE